MSCRPGRNCRRAVHLAGPALCRCLAAALCLVWSVITATAAPVQPWTAGAHEYSDALRPAGVVRIGDMAFEVDPKTVVELVGGARERQPIFQPDQPASVTHLAFLHTFHVGKGIENFRAAVAQSIRNLELPPAAPIVFTYEVEYVDGSTVDFPVRWGESIEEWYRVQDIAPMLWARQAYVRTIDAASREHAVAYAAVWPNPRPESAVKQVRIRPSPERWIDYGRALVFATLPIRNPSPGRSYFVDPSPIGRDDAAGSLDQPLASIQRALDLVQPGDTVYLRGGLYALHRVAELKGRGGAPGRWVTISAYPGETPILDGTGVLYDASLPQFNGMDEPGPPYQRDMGILAVRDVPGGHVRIQGLQVQNSQRSGISADGIFFWADRPGKPRPVGLDVSFNTTYCVREIGINVKFWDDVVVIGNRLVRSHSERMVFSVPGNKRYGLELPPGSTMNMRHHGQEALDLTYNTGFEIAYNEVFGGGKEAIDCISVQDGTIHHNSIDSALNGIYIDSWAGAIANLRIYRNFIRNAFAGIPFATEGSGDLVNCEVYENIIIDSHMAGIDISEATYKAQPATVRGHLVRNNTIHRTGHHAVTIGWNGIGLGVGGFPQNPNVREIELRDNIVTDTSQTPMRSNLPDLEARSIRFHHNLTWPAEDRKPPGTNLSRASGYLRGDATVAADPRYMDPERGDFRVQPGSPAIGSASDGGDLGALPSGVAWRPGFDWVGRPTAFYRGEREWRPVFIPREKFNTFRNHLQRPRFFQESRYGEDLQALPSGMQVLGGVTWQIEPDAHTSMPNVITLMGRQSEAPDRDVLGLPIGRKAGHIAFLHTAFVAPDARATAASQPLAKYVVRYADGTLVDVPIVAGVNIAHWSHDTSPLPQAAIAWTIPTILRQHKIAWCTLFGFEWLNPHPDKEIAAIDLMRVGDPQRGTVALFSISTAP